MADNRPQDTARQASETAAQGAEAARDANVPYLMSGAANASMENAAKLAPNNLWYQIYGARDRSFQLDLVRRAKDLGLSTIAVTCAQA